MMGSLAPLFRQTGHLSRQPKKAVSAAKQIAATVAVLATVCVTASPAAAQSWEAFTDANNLVSVTGVESEVWCPSLNGLHRFDPETGRFTRFFRQPGGLISNKTVTAEKDAQGNVWIGTDGSGASFLNPGGAWRSVSEFDGLPSDSVQALHPFADGMWIGTAQGLAFFVESQIIAVWPDGVNPSPFRSNRIQAIASSTTETWLGTPDGVYLSLDGVSWDTTNTGLTDLDVQSLVYDSQKLWAVTADGSVWSGGESGTWTETETGIGMSLGRHLNSGAGALYLGASDGVYQWNRLGLAWQRVLGTVSPSQPLEADVGVTEDGGLFAGNGEGLWQWQDSLWINLKSPGPSGNFIHGMCLDGRTVYVTTRFNGVSRYDDTRGWRHFKAGGTRDTSFISNDFHFSALCDRNGDKWFGDWGQSIARLDDSGPVPRFTHYFVDDNGDSARYTFAGHILPRLRTRVRSAGAQPDLRTGLLQLQLRHRGDDERESGALDRLCSGRDHVGRLRRRRD
jgi:ligand-binding sensor domain-containing protein